MLNTIKRLWNEEEAANAVEYALITGIIALGVIGALVYYRDKLDTGFKGMADKAATDMESHW